MRELESAFTRVLPPIVHIVTRCQHSQVLPCSAACMVAVNEALPPKRRLQGTTCMISFCQRLEVACYRIRILLLTYLPKRHSSVSAAESNQLPLPSDVSTHHHSRAAGSQFTARSSWHHQPSTSPHQPCRRQPTSCCPRPTPSRCKARVSIPHKLTIAQHASNQFILQQMRHTAQGHIQDAGHKLGVLLMHLGHSSCTHLSFQMPVEPSVMPRTH